MNISSKQHGSVDVVQLPQRLVMANATAVRKELLEMVALGHHFLVLDLAGTTFVDSSGLSVLVSALMAANKVNGKVALLKPTNGVRALIELTRMHEVFAIFADQEAAIDQLTQEAAA
jgi:anti-sigma B factor antagonist